MYKFFLLFLGQFLSQLLYLALCPDTSFAQNESVLNSSSPATLRGQVVSSLEFPALSKSTWRYLPDNNVLESINSILGTGDFNGDTFADILVSSTSTAKVFILLSDGESSLKLLTDGVGIENLYPEQKFLIADFDGNACSDLLLIPGLDSTKQKMRLLLSDCKRTFSPQTLLVNSLDRRYVNFVVANNPSGKCPDLLACPARPELLCKRYRCREGFEYEEYKILDTYGPVFSGVFDPSGKEKLITPIVSPIVTRGSGSSWYVLKENEKGGDILVQFNSKFEWMPFFVGDLNGDGLEDVVAQGNGLQGLWVGLGAETTGLEVAVRGLDIELKEGNSALADLDGDGRKELLVLINSKDGLSVYKWQDGGGIADVGIFINDELYTQTDKSGYFRFQMRYPGKIKIRTRLEGYVFSQRERELDLQPGNKGLTFIGIDVSGKNKIKGRAIDLAEPLPGPYLCLGYNQEPVNYNRWSSSDRFCARGHAFYAMTPAHRDAKRAEDVAGIGTCCRLPFADILLDEHVEVTGACPDNHLVTGVKKDYNCKTCPGYLRCTKINTVRYTLGTATGGKIFGTTTRTQQWKDYVAKSSIPLALRYGLLRASMNTWLSYGCIGYPWGSILVEKRPGTCSDLKFKQILYNGAPTDPPPGTPVEMFPDCVKINNIHDPRAGCVVR